MEAAKKEVNIPMKIAMFGHKRIPSREGGVEIVVGELSHRMAAMGHEVVCYNRQGHHVSGAEFDRQCGPQWRGVSLRDVPTVPKRGLAAASSSMFAALAAAFSRAQVVHIHAEGPAIMSWLPRLFGKRVVVTVHGLDWQRQKWAQGLGARYIRWGEKAAVRFAHEIIVLSENVQRYFLETYGRETVLIPNGITRPKVPGQELIQARFDLRKDDYILFLGRLVPEKGIHYLIEAFRDVKTEKRLVIAGGVSDSDGYMRQLHALADGDYRVQFTGFVQGQQWKELMGNAYVYALPSDLEGMPLSLLEAMGFGNCCLVSDIPECASVVQDHGVVFPRGDVAALTQALQRLCDEPETVAAYKATAADFICSRYPWEDVVRRTLEVYEKKGRTSLEHTDDQQVSASQRGI